MQETQEMRGWSLSQEDLLEKDMADHSSIPAWDIPWTEKPGRLQSIGRKESDMTERHTTAQFEDGVWGLLMSNVTEQTLAMSSWRASGPNQP